MRQIIQALRFSGEPFLFGKEMVFRAGAATASFHLAGKNCCFSDLPLFADSCRMKIRR
ncbi:hypothetical protein HMPREF3038_00918 [Akkermansia sp. KLE1797]|nr:hypothetical protein HMPREF3038_00918 [Akkermansia sp. KLE1797]KXU54435.1 hypothetical protein HMPREF3039_01327 [Akkermansia sp. KLE1798]KZA04827.1 hypothetical protein HMPREF1326_01404 [Akkermansia sp. KLE1605]